LSDAARGTFGGRPWHAALLIYDLAFCCGIVCGCARNAWRLAPRRVDERSRRRARSPALC